MVVKKKISFGGHIETYYTLDDFPKERMEPGMHIGPDGILVDKKNYIVVLTDLVKPGETIRVCYGYGKCYGPIDMISCARIYTNW